MAVRWSEVPFIMLNAVSEYMTVQALVVVMVGGFLFLAAILAFLAHKSERDRKHEAAKHNEWKEQSLITQKASRDSHERALQLDDRKKAIAHHKDNIAS
jgi:Flp pilus assembly protein TadB